MSGPRVTVALLTFNGQEYLRDLLNALDAQESPAGHEVLVIDSGSNDATLDIVAEYPHVRLHQIPNTEFGHGRTRNLALSLASGEVVMFITQDAVPAHPRWMIEMLRPFDVHDDVVCVFGKQLPRPDCCPTVKRDVLGLFSSFGPDHAISLQLEGPLETVPQCRDAATFFSDVNSAVQRQWALAHPYEDVDYAEDQAFGRDVIAAGKIKAYAPLGSVWHSHNYPPVTYLRRMYDEFAGLRRTTGQAIPLGRRELLVGWVRPTLADWRFTLRDPAYGPLAKLKWLAQAPVYNIFRRVAIRAAARERPSGLDGWLALEGRTRAAALTAQSGAAASAGEQD
jgi:rhamnosyltransferase